MMFYKVKGGFVVVAECNYRYFESNFPFIESFKVTQPRFYSLTRDDLRKDTAWSLEPYAPIEKLELSRYINQVIKEYTYQAKKLSMLKNKFKL